MKSLEFFMYYFNVTAWLETERKSEGGLPSADSFPKWSQQLELGLSQARSLEFNPVVEQSVVET